MKTLLKPMLIGVATCAVTLTTLNFIPYQEKGPDGQPVGEQITLLDLLDPAAIGRSLCGEQGKKRGLFFRPEFLEVFSPKAYAETPEPEVDAGPPLWEGMGDHHMEITTKSPEAQKYFDQGLALTFGFNHWEAGRAFKKAQELDPTCAMCYWAEAFVLGPNINAAMDASAVEPAFAAVSKAVMLKSYASKKEKRLIDAMAKRYSPDPEADRDALNQAYSDAMEGVHRKYKDDQHIATFYAESLMDLTPWDYWERDFATPKAHIAKAIEAIEGVLEANPNHAGAIHLYIHLMEPSVTPGKAEPAADRLAALIPGAGHLVHMPGHTYFRVGRYLDALSTNIEAVKVDEAYLAEVEGSPVYRYGYYPHNVHFVLVSAQMAGDGKTTMDFAKKLDGLIPMESVMTQPWIATIKASPMFATLQFGTPKDIAAMPKPPAEIPYLAAMWHYVQGVEAAWQGKDTDALNHAEAIAAITGATEFGEQYSAGEVQKELFEMAELLLRARVDQKAGNYDAAIDKVKGAIALEDKLVYSEPPVWYYPVDQTLGALYLQKGEPAAAVEAFRSSLIRHPNNAWSLYGLSKAQEAAEDPTLPITQQLMDKAIAVKEEIALERL